MIQYIGAYKTDLNLIELESWRLTCSRGSWFVFEIMFTDLAVPYHWSHTSFPIITITAYIYIYQLKQVYLFEWCPFNKQSVIWPCDTSKDLSGLHIFYDSIYCGNHYNWLGQFSWNCPLFRFIGTVKIASILVI